MPFFQCVWLQVWQIGYTHEASLVNIQKAAYCLVVVFIWLVEFNKLSNCWRSLRGATDDHNCSFVSFIVCQTFPKELQTALKASSSSNTGSNWLSDTRSRCKAYFIKFAGFFFFGLGCLLIDKHNLQFLLGFNVFAFNSPSLIFRLMRSSSTLSTVSLNFSKPIFKWHCCASKSSRFSLNRRT